MRFVLDSCVVIKCFLPETYSTEALRLQSELRQGLHIALAPDILPVEVGHAFTRAERAGRMSCTVGFGRWTDAMTDAPNLFPSLPLMPRAYALSSQYRIGVYDCLYVALAEREQCELVTADDRLINALPGFPIVHVTSL